LLPFKKWPKTWKTVVFKEYPRLDKIILPDPLPLKNSLLTESLMKRKSIRNFSVEKFSLQKLSSILYWSGGLRENNPPWQGKRFYPSGGGRYPLEIYVLSQNAELSQGLYHYNLRSHSLEILIDDEAINTGDFFSHDNTPWIKEAGCLLIITACFRRNTIKYGDRGYRHLLIETGFFGQNIYLVSTAMGIASCASGGYIDDKLNNLLDVDGIDESVIFVMASGNKAKKQKTQ